MAVKLKIHPLFLVLGAYFFITNQIFIFLIMLILALLHEFGHYFIANNLGYNLKTICLMPYGAVLTGNIEELKLIDEIKIALAGPMVNLIFSTFLIALWWVFPVSYAYTDILAQTSLSIALVNFLPIFPLDGGRIALATFSLWFGKKAGKIIMKVLGILLSVFLLTLFVVSIFNKLNITLLFFSVMLFLTSIEKKEEYKYIKIATLNKEKLMRGIEYKKIAVNENVTIQKLIKLIDGDKLNEVDVYDDNLNLKRKISASKLNEIILNASVYQKLKDVNLPK